VNTTSLEPTPTAGVVIFDGESVLLVAPGATSRHERGVFGVPAGHIENGESAVSAAVRECEEESGLIFSERDLLRLPREYEAALTRRDGSSELMRWIVFATTHFTGRLRTSSESEPQWVTLRSLPQLTLQRNVADAIAQARQALA
jgi:ADP-ribose pyrophosphatase YjhB (NUDIX family)